jgi:hypothetical protein
VAICRRVRLPGRVINHQHQRHKGWLAVVSKCVGWWLDPVALDKEWDERRGMERKGAGEAKEGGAISDTVGGHQGGDAGFHWVEAQRNLGLNQV